MTPHQFLDALWGYKPEDQYILIWTLPDKRSYWFREIAAAGDFVAKVSFLDVYVGVGLASQDHGPTHRCVSEEISGICGFWADLDLKSEAHKKALPLRIEDALTIIPSPFQPSIVVATGNGAHVWWLFKEPWVFDNDEERKDAATLISRWQTMLRANSQQKGWAFDRLADLARVLRIPGTVNQKDAANPKKVFVHSSSDRRYNPSEFLDYLDDLGIPDPEAEERAAREWAERFKDKPLVINLDASIPDDVLKLWLETDMRFRNTWNRQRHDLKDQSQSGYDLALACFGMDAGISEQQIVDLIVHHRRLHGKAQRRRLDYFQRTISKAAKRTGSGCAVVLAEPDDSAATPPDHQAPADPERAATAAADARRAALDDISRVVGTNIIRIVKVDGKDPSYRVELECGKKIEFQNLAKLTNGPHFRMALMTALDRHLPKIKPKAWDEVERWIMQAMDKEETPEELGWEGAARIWLGDYLEETGFIPSIEGQSVQNMRKPMVHKGRVTVCASDFQIYVNKTHYQALSIKAVAGMLSAIGAKKDRVRGSKFKEQTRYALPVEDFDPAEYQKQLKEAGHGE